MKKLCFVFLILVLSLNFVSAAPKKEIKLIIDGKEVIFPDQKPVVENQRTLVPVRFVTEALGAKVDWIQEEQKVKIEKSGELIELILGQKKVKVGNKNIELDVAAIAMNQRTMVPLRFVSEALGCTVDWVQESYTVVITTRKADFIEPIFEPKFYTAKNEYGGVDVDILLKNYRDYTSDYQFRSECTNFKQINKTWVNYEPIPPFEADLTLWQPAPYGISILRRQPYFADKTFKNPFYVKPGMVFETMVYVKKGDAIKEYPITIEMP